MTAFLVAGFIGGIIRGSVGIIKYSTSYKDVDIRPWYFLGMVIISGLIGLVAVWVTQDLGVMFLGVETISPALALVIGYAGGDFLENVFKILTKKETLFR